MENMNLETLVEAYLAIRTEREVLLQKFDETDKKLKEDMTSLEQAMLVICNATNADSIKTSQGTVMRKMNERFYCTDWDNFRKFVVENQALELLEKRIHQGNFKEFMTENEGDGLPPGVNVMREFGVSVRKPSAR
ncbi:MAG: hypothetical protein EBR82_45300 [Caulobacteraceae bacterium]|nr:hypothetical protein [Caulobacteraceae bacterium]